MTRKEEELLRTLSLAIEQLKSYTLALEERLGEVVARSGELEEENKRLYAQCEELRLKNDLLLSSRVIVADEGDWLAARKRLEELRKDILKGIQLLETV